MMGRLYVTFLWHYHQPYYMDPVTGHFALPWVRLHGIKDYIGMARLLAEFPDLKQVINFVPSLLKQIEEYLDGATDTAMILARTPADSLTQGQVEELLDTFFAANRENMIHPYPRYRQLLTKRGPGHKSAEKAAREFSQEELRDLQVWGNLTWFHPTVVEKDSGLRSLIEKDRGFTESDKCYVLDRQHEILAEIVPLHRKLAESGQLELITSPFYHTIVPLLCDYATALAAEPDLARPTTMVSAPEDAAAQIERAVAYHERTFGARPRGMWPSEGAVSHGALSVFAGAGLDWIATDEEILAQTLGTHFERDAAGVVGRPEQLYRPHRFTSGRRQLTVVFRDQALSDLIGFQSQLREPLDAARELVERLEGTSRKAPENSLVVIALDGENCWEHYPGQGVEFLRHLYRLLSDAPEIETTTVSEYLDRFGPGEEQAGPISSGSWIGHSFASWMGHWEKNRGWEHLARARDFYVTRVAEGNVPQERITAALEEIYIAEGSDWFWWYGEDHSTGSAAQFDSLFRRHVRKIYELLEGRPPDELLQPIIDNAARESWKPPRELLDIRVDGRRTSFFEWLGAGTYEQERAVGAMERAEPVPVTAMQFGFSSDSFFLALDVQAAGREPEAELTVELWLGDAAAPSLTVAFGRDGVRAGDAAARAARGRIIEIAAPLTLLGLAPGRRTEFFVRVLESQSAVQRLPVSGAIPLAVPADPDSAYSGAEDMA